MTGRAPNTGPRVVVVGGGLAGMSASMRLAEAGVPVTLLEARGRLGGRASSFTHAASGEVVDNCQHVLLGCCTALMDFYRRLGVLGQIEWHRRIFFADGQGRVDALEAEDLPSPLHLMPSLLRLRALSLGERLSIARGLRAIARLDEGCLAALRGETFARWLAEHGQSDGEVKKFWSLIAASAANELPQHLSAAVALKVFRDGFLGDAEAYVMGLARVPLVELYGQAAKAIGQAGGELRLSAGVQGLGRASGGGWAVITQGEVWEADAVVLAVPPNVAAKLCAAELASECPALAKLGHFEFSAIIGVHLWLECADEVPVMPQPLLGLMGGQLHWLFNKGMTGRRQRLHGVISAANRMTDLSNQRVLELAVQEIQRVLPAAAKARLVQGLVVKERRATFSATPAAVAARPGPRTAARGLYLAGDWCETGWPATMESAVRSGDAAARALVEDWGGR